MQIVIDIPDEQIEKCLEESKYIHENEGEKGSVDIVLLYTNKKLEFVDISRKNDFYSLTDKYTVLPKGHGDLKDMEDIYEVLEGWNDDTSWIVDAIERQTPTVIEADIESEE
jgi:adenylosuccinate synthase